MANDDLYHSGRVEEDFTFNDQVADVFDDMLDRSVPFYHEVIATTADIIRQMAKPGSQIIDLGCSTGATLLTLARMLPDMKLQYTGIDNASAMIAKAQRKARMYSKTDVIQFHKNDITTAPLDKADIILCNYTLQFLRPLQRGAFIKRIYQALPEDGILLISEKIICNHRRLNRKFIDIYHDFKRNNGYSELEIAAKREALENILIPFSVEENLTLLKQNGFGTVETYFRWVNFASFVALKN